ncbi:cysteine desulfurase sulfur acceptor subunit CsdE [Enterobacteriaceae bacterium 4M9]|nr:cysteine desulfurase sulfur acceptor subunit CsdE [Enterobacteriaceae bacterium 4M9]
MTSTFLAGHPFGSTVSADDLRAIFTPLTQWEDKYRQLILLGKQLPALPESLKREEIEVRGCENRVWLGHTMLDDRRLHFYGDSEGRIVRGLLAVLLTAIEGKTPAQLRQHDPLTLFDELGLSGELSASRSQGLAALAQRVRQIAAQ